MIEVLVLAELVILLLPLEEPPEPVVCLCIIKHLQINIGPLSLLGVVALR